MEGQTEEAQQDLMEAAVKKRPDDGPLLSTALAKLELAESKPVEAEQWSHKALKADGANAEAPDTLATSLRDPGSFYGGGRRPGTAPKRHGPPPKG